MDRAIMLRDNDIEVARLLIDHGASPFDERFGGLQPLRDIYGEAHQKNYEVAKSLLRCINIKKYMTDDNDQDLLLVTAAKCGCTTTVQQIIDRETQGDTKSWVSLPNFSSGLSSALAEAAHEGHKDMVALLLDHDIYPWPEPLENCYERDLPLLKAILLRGHKEVVEVLIDKILTLRKPFHELWGSDLTFAYAIEFPSIFQLLSENGVFDNLKLGTERVK